MGNEFTADEIREVIRAARFYSPGVTAEQLEGAVELQRRLADSGYLEAVHAVSRLEKDEGVLCTEALDRCKQLLHDTAQKEAELASLQENFVARQHKNQQAEDEHKQMKAAIEQAKEELQAVQAQRQKEEKELVAFGKKADKQKERIDKELEEYQLKANITMEEITGAGNLKEQLASHGFTIEFTLDLCQEFVGHENAREELARALKERQTLTNYIADLNQWAKGQKKALESELNELKSEKDRREAEIKNLEQARHQLENILGQLQADVAHEEELRMFYHRYYAWSGLLEWLASWDQIFFLRCNNPLYAVTGAFARSAGGAHVWTDKAGPKCPHCGLNTLIYDERLYQALNWPVAEPLKLQLGE